MSISTATSASTRAHLSSWSTNLITQRNPVSNPTAQGSAFIGFLIETGYLFHVVKVTEFVVAVLLLLGRFVALAWVLFAPILVNIRLFHYFLQPAGSELALAVAALHGYFVFVYRERFRGVLEPSYRWPYIAPAAAPLALGPQRAVVGGASRSLERKRSKAISNHVRPFWQRVRGEYGTQR